MSLVEEFKKSFLWFKTIKENSHRREGESEILNVTVILPVLSGDVWIEIQSQVEIVFSRDGVMFSQEEENAFLISNGIWVSGTADFQDGQCNPFGYGYDHRIQLPYLWTLNRPNEMFDVRLKDNPAVAVGDFLRFTHPIAMENPVLDLKGSIPQILDQLILRIRTAGSWEDTDIFSHLYARTVRSFKKRHLDLMEEICTRHGTSRGATIKTDRGCLDLTMDRNNCITARATGMGPCRSGILRARVRDLWLSAIVYRYTEVQVPILYWPEYRETMELASLFRSFLEASD